MPEASLYERLGGEEATQRIATSTFDNHVKNPVVSPRYATSDRKKVIRLVAEFICFSADRNTARIEKESGLVAGGKPTFRPERGRVQPDETVRRTELRSPNGKHRKRFRCPAF